MKLSQLVQKKRESILNIAAKHGAFNVRIFGSVARGEDTEESDIDFLVEMEAGKSLLDRIALIQDLEDYLGCKVDVVTRKSLREYFRDRIIILPVHSKDIPKRTLYNIIVNQARLTIDQWNAL